MGANHRTGVVVVGSGAGLEALFTELGATVVPGGETLNPSTAELLAGIRAVPVEEVLVLPNSSNVIMAAERACELSEKRAVVLPTRTQQAARTPRAPISPQPATLPSGPGQACSYTRSSAAAAVVSMT